MKRLASVLLALVVVALASMTAFAHGHGGGCGCGHGGYRMAAVRHYTAPYTEDYPLCQTEGCLLYGYHTHDDAYFFRACDTSLCGHGVY